MRRRTLAARDERRGAPGGLPRRGARVRGRAGPGARARRPAAARRAALGRAAAPRARVRAVAARPAGGRARGPGGVPVRGPAPRAATTRSPSRCRRWRRLPGGPGRTRPASARDRGDVLLRRLQVAVLPSPPLERPASAGVADAGAARVRLTRGARPSAARATQPRIRGSASPAGRRAWMNAVARRRPSCARPRTAARTRRSRGGARRTAGRPRRRRSSRTSPAAATRVPVSVVKGAGEAKQSCRNEAPLFDTAFICLLVDRQRRRSWSGSPRSRRRSAVSGEISV